MPDKCFPRSPGPLTQRRAICVRDHFSPAVPAQLQADVTTWGRACPGTVVLTAVTTAPPSDPFFFPCTLPCLLSSLYLRTVANKIKHYLSFFKKKKKEETPCLAANVRGFPSILFDFKVIQLHVQTDSL